MYKIQRLNGNIEPVTKTDIIFGRGCGANKHHGNILFREHVQEFTLEYGKLKKDAKHNFIKEIVFELIERFSFCKKVNESLFQELDASNKEDLSLIYNKVSQLLRDKHTDEAVAKTAGNLTLDNGNKGYNTNYLLSGDQLMRVFDKEVGKGSFVATLKPNEVQALLEGPLLDKTGKPVIGSATARVAKGQQSTNQIK